MRQVGGYHYDDFVEYRRVHRFISDESDKPLEIIEPMLIEMIYKGLIYQQV